MREAGQEGCVFHAPAPVRFRTTVPSPIGDLLLLSDGAALTGLYMATNRSAPQAGVPADEGAAPFKEAICQLQAYFRHELTAFNLPLAPSGTRFQLGVWQALLAIPCGHTTSYGELADRLGSPRAVRAVGQANARNPLALIVPCHRVIGRSGHLVGYASGLEPKRWLLAHEAALGLKA